MNTQKHTPGPWTLAGGITGQDENGMRSPIATISNSWRNREIDDANARLIAAAPELLEALRNISSVFEVMVGNKKSDVLASARCAIAKAEGNS